MTFAPIVTAGVQRADERNFAWYLRGVVAASKAGPVLKVRGFEYPLPSGTSFPPGAHLRLRLAFETGAWQLQILGPVPSPASGPSLTELLGRLDLPATAEQASRLLPAHLPKQAGAIATLIHRLAAAEGAGPALGRLVQILGEAVASGAVQVSPQTLAAVAGWLVGPTSDPRVWKEYLRRSTDLTPEAVLARLLLDDGEGGSDDDTTNLAATPEHVLAELEADDTLRRYARASGQGQEWAEALAELSGRIDGDRLVQLHGLSAPYRFVEIPVQEESGWRRCQLHLLGGERSAVAIDVATEALGAVWMRFSAAAGVGRLTFRAERTATCEALARDLEDLTEGLACAGYNDVSVEIEAWDGDRIRAVVELFDARRPVEVNA